MLSSYLLICVLVYIHVYFNYNIFWSVQEIFSRYHQKFISLFIQNTSPWYLLVFRICLVIKRPLPNSKLKDSVLVLFLFKLFLQDHHYFLFHQNWTFILQISSILFQCYHFYIDFNVARRYWLLHPVSEDSSAPQVAAQNSLTQSNSLKPLIKYREPDTTEHPRKAAQICTNVRSFDFPYTDAGACSLPNV